MTHEETEALRLEILAACGPLPTGLTARVDFSLADRGWFNLSVAFGSTFVAFSGLSREGWERYPGRTVWLSLLERAEHSLRTAADELAKTRTL